MGQIVQDHESLARILRTLKTQGKSVIFTNGCFDLLHVGHVRALLDASSRGHYLIVAVNSDKAVSRLKGDGRPVQNEAERAELVAAIEGVDYVTIFDEDTTDDLLRLFRPTAVAKGPEYTMKNLPEADTLREIDCELLAVGDPKKHATRDLIDQVKAGKAAGRVGRKKTGGARKKAAAKAKASGKAKAKASKSKVTAKKAGKAKAKAKKTIVKGKATRKATAKKTTRKAKAPTRRRAAAARGGK